MDVLKSRQRGFSGIISDHILYLIKDNKVSNRLLQSSCKQCLILYINMANFPKAVEGCWGRGLLDDVKWKN